MFVPCKPWPFGNEYHMVCCSLSGILWQMEIVEGKDTPLQIVPKFNNQEKPVGLLLHVLESIFGKGNMVVQDSKFGVLKGIMELKKCVVYASALIKKWKYWPKYIKGEAIKQHFEGKQVGECDSWKGNMDEVLFHVYALKEPDYVMSLMSTYGTNLQTGEETSHEWVMGVAQSNKRHSTTLRSWEISFCTSTPSMITTINDTYLLVWRLFGL